MKILETIENTYKHKCVIKSQKLETLHDCKGPCQSSLFRSNFGVCYFKQLNKKRHKLEYIVQILAIKAHDGDKKFKQVDYITSLLYRRSVYGKS